MIRLLLTPAKMPGKFIARLEDGTEVCQSDRPIVDGARNLLSMGTSPDAILLARHVGSAYDSFAPQSVGEWAKWTYSETERDGLRRVRWQPRPEALLRPTGSPKSGGAG